MDEPTLQIPVPVPPLQRLIHATLLLVALAASFGLAAWLLRGGVWVSATAAPWLQGVDKAGSVLDDGLLAVTLRHVARMAGLGPAPAVRLVQLFAAALLLFAVGRAAAQLRNRWTGFAAVALLLLWPPARQTLQTLSVETLLALASVGLAASWINVARAPLRAIVLSGLCLALLLLLHPVGFAATPLLALALLLAPGPAPTPGLPGRPLLPVRPVWLPWLAALLLALGLLTLGLPTGGIKTTWLHAVSALRAPASGLRLGWLASRPVVGPLVTLVAQMPLILLLLAGHLALQASRERQRPESLVVALALGWLCVAAAVGHPVPDSLDLLVVVAPLLCVAAAVSAHDVARSAWARPTSTARVAAVFLALAAAASWLADARLARDDRRASLAHIPGVLDNTAPLRPAVLAPQDAALLAAHLEPTAILPGHMGGSRVADALKTIEPKLQTASFGPAYTAALVLLPARPSDPVTQAFAETGLRVACSADMRTCLYRVRGRPDAGR